LICAPATRSNGKHGAADVLHHLDRVAVDRVDLARARLEQALDRVRIGLAAAVVQRVDDVGSFRSVTTSDVPSVVMK
jgi:hypothetical protein